MFELNAIIVSQENESSINLMTKHGLGPREDVVTEADSKSMNFAVVLKIL